jgi:hypothetical protein
MDGGRFRAYQVLSVVVTHAPERNVTRPALVRRPVYGSESERVNLSVIQKDTQDAAHATVCAKRRVEAGRLPALRELRYRPQGSIHSIRFSSIRRHVNKLVNLFLEAEAAPPSPFPVGEPLGIHLGSLLQFDSWGIKS